MAFDSARCSTEWWNLKAVCNRAQTSVFSLTKMQTGDIFNTQVPDLKSFFFSLMGPFRL